MTTPPPEADFTAEDDDENAADFTGEPPSPPPAHILIGDEIARKRENTRGWLALSLVGLLVLLEGALFTAAVWKVRPLDRELLALLLTGLLTPVVALVGTVLGFYFGEKAAKGE